MTTSCGECGLDDDHEDDCLTAAVERGRMTPRERQIRLLEVEQARRADNPVTALKDAIGQAGADGGQIERLILGTNAWARLLQLLPNGFPLTGRNFMGYQLDVDARVDPDTVLAVRRPSYSSLGDSRYPPEPAMFGTGTTVRFARFEHPLRHRGQR